MNRIVIHRAGGYEQLRMETHAAPVPGAGEVRIAVSHIGVNYADCVVRMGLYASAKKLVGWPITPGFEVAGIVDAVGAGVTDLVQGTPVIGVTLFNGYSTSLVVPRAQVFAMPPGLEPAQAAGLPAVFLTAWFALHQLAHVRRGERVLIHSAAGGVGCAAVQLAVGAGAEVTAIVGAPHKRELPAALGAAHVIVKEEQDWRTAVDRIAPRGYDVILDPNGVSTLAHSYARVAPPGRLVIYGFHSMLPRRGGRPNWPKLAWDWLRTPRFNPLRLTMENRSVLAFNLSFLSTRADLMIPAMQEVLAGFDSGRLRPLPVTIYPLAEVARAHRDLESGRTQGKLVLVV